MPGDQEIVLECAQCGARTRYKDIYVHGQFRPLHKLDCTAASEQYPKMYLQAINPSK